MSIRGDIIRKTIGRGTNDNSFLVAAIGVLCLIRFPFLPLGYGNDGDGWMVMLSARRLSETGEYMASRLPGYPLQELVFAALGGPVTYMANGITLIFFAIACWLVYTLTARIRKENSLSVMAIFAMTPVIFINSVNSMDYLLALTCLLASLYFAMNRMVVLSGIVLGLSVGFRLTSAIYGIPLAMLVYLMDRRGLSVAKLFFSSVAIALLSYSIVLYSYGFGFLQHSGGISRSLVRMGYKATVELWGVIGTITLLAVAATLILAPSRVLHRWKSLTTESQQFLLAVAMMGCFAVLLFLYLPDEGAYLIPFVTAVVLVLGALLSKRVLIGVFLAMTLSGTLLNVTKSGLHLEGPLVQDYLRRRQNLDFLSEMRRIDSTLPEKSIVISGVFLPMILVELELLRETRGKYEYHLNEEELQEASQSGRVIYYLPGLAEGNIEIHNIDLRSFGAQELKLKTPPIQRYD